jgi:hypothetical protein
MSPQELQVQGKRELEKKQETTAPARMFMPTADIFETENALPSSLKCRASIRATSTST